MDIVDPNIPVRSELHHPRSEKVSQFLAGSTVNNPHSPKIEKE